MKKFLFWTALASVALTGCVKNDVEPNPSLGQESEITFNAPVVGKVMRSNVQGEIGPGYHTGEDFVVTGWAHLENEFDPATATVYIDQKVATYTSTVTADDVLDPSVDEGTGSWHFMPAYYWPKTHKLTFSAYSPASFQATSKVIDKTTGITLTGVKTPTDVSEHYDLLYSNRVFNQTEKTYAHENDAYKGVDVLFHHAFSSVHVYVKMDKDYSSVEKNQIIVNNIWFDQVYFDATFEEGLNTGLENNSANYSRWKAWTNVTDNFDIEGGNIAIDGTTAVKYGTTAMFIPQDLHDMTKATSLNVLYTIVNPDGVGIQETMSFPLSGLKDNGSNSIEEWVKGKRYTYTLTFGLNEIYLAPSVDPWDDVIMSDINI